MKPITPWLCFAAVIGLGIYVAWRNYPWWHPGPDRAFEFWFGWILGTFVTVFLSVLAGGGGSLLASYIGKKSDQVWHEAWRAKMVSMRSSDGVEGKVAGGLFMISGYVSSQQVYYYYTGADGTYKPQKWNASRDTYICEEDRKDGEVVQFDAQFKRPIMAWFAYPSDAVRADFHIPKGSIRQGFELK